MSEPMKPIRDILSQKRQATRKITRINGDVVSSEQSAVPGRLPVGDFLGESDDDVNEALQQAMALAATQEYSAPAKVVPLTRNRKKAQTAAVEEERVRVLPEESHPQPIRESAPVCPLCQDRGFLRHNVPLNHPMFGKLKQCKCKVREAAQKLFGGAHIPADYTSYSFASYLQLPLDAEQRKVAGMVQAFGIQRLAEPYQGKKRGLYLYGPWGTGKTALAIELLKAAIDADQTALYLSTSELFDILREAIAASYRLKRGYGDTEDREEESAGSKLLRLVQSVQWLVLDDLGVECNTPFVIERLYRILEGRRSTAGLYTIFTSNRDISALERKWHPEGQSEAFDDAMRIIERLGEYCVPLHLSGRNLRKG
jgi:DNA replication protein DnaC